MNIDYQLLNRNWIKVRNNLVGNHRSCHLPLFANSVDGRENSEFIGSGFLASYDGRILGITCAHVVALLAGRELTTICSVNGNEIKLAGSIACHEIYDLAVVDLNGLDVSNIPIINAEGVKLNDCDWMYIEGFPKRHNADFLTDRSVWTPVGLRLRYLDRLSSRVAGFELPFNPSDSLANSMLEFELSNFTDDDLTNVEKMFRPRLMSGSPVYVIGSVGAILREPKAVSPKIVGVFTEHHEKPGIALFVDIFATIDSVIE